MALSDLLNSSTFWIISWVIVFVAALVIEIAVPGLVSIWFAGGALVSLFVAMFGGSMLAQILCFVGVSAVLLILTKFVFKKTFLKAKTVPTNTDALIGQEIRVVKGFDKNTHGEGKIRDLVWTLVTNEDVRYVEGEFAIIKDIQGNHVIVAKKEGK